jgi:dipeptidase E
MRAPAMTSRLFLISSNLALPHFTTVVSHLARGAARAAVVTTAEPKLKQRSRNAVLARDTLLAVGVPAVEFFDFDMQPSAGLAAFDLAYLAGGNPYHLLQRVRETGANAVIEEMVEAGRPIIGSSAGALLLGRSLNVLPVFDTSVPNLGCKDTDALGLVPFTVLPQANRWKARFADYTARIATAAVLCRSAILEIADDEGLLIDGDTVTRIGSTFLSSPVQPSAQPTA